MNDPQIRALLYPLLRGGHVLDELPVGSTRADVVHLKPHEYHGFEVKGDGDTLKRLANQLKCYAHAFDLVTFVVTDKHHANALIALPAWCGLWIARPTGIAKIRLARPHGQMQKGQMLALLWQSEIIEFLNGRGVKGLSRYRNFELFSRAEKDDNIPVEDVAAFVRQRLIDRLPDRLTQRAHLKALRDSRR